MPRPTLKKLAKELDLSVTTVSRALAGYSDVSKLTRARIVDAANAAGYVPNSAGKSLVTGRTGFVGILMPLSDKPQIDPFFSEFLAGLGEGLQAQERDLFIATVGPHQQEMDVLRRVVEGGRADAVVLTRIFEDDPRVEYLLKRRFPFITHGRTLVNNQSRRWVDTDGAKAFAEAFSLLYDNGHRQFALVSIDEPMTFKHFREHGLQDAKQGINDSSVTLDKYSSPRFDTQARNTLIRQLLSSNKRPTAIIALTDEIALSVIEQASLLGIEVPAQLSVVGFDNLPASAWSNPKLSTFDQDIRSTAFALATELIDVLDDNTKPDTSSNARLRQARFIARDSHGPVATGHAY